MNESEHKPIDLDSNRNICSTIDEFESRFFPTWYEKQKTIPNRAEGDSFGESLARFSAEKHLRDIS
jgi:hypothetical protein